MTTVWIGSYPAAGLGSQPGLGEGLWRAERDPEGRWDARQVTTQAAPSFVVVHPIEGIVYSVSEDQPTLLVATDASSHERRATVTVGGWAGCHLLLSGSNEALYVCNYMTGEVAVICLDPSGLPVGDVPSQVFSHEGSGPRQDRQEGPHAHFSMVSPDGGWLLVADLGTDQLRRFRIGERGLLVAEGIASTLPAGSGPRHMAVRGELIYVVCELDHTLRTLRWDRASATAEVIAEAPTTLVAQRTGDTVYDAHVAVVSAGARECLLVSVRGADVVSVFDVAPEGELTYRAAFDTGYWPRHFAVVPSSEVADAAGASLIVTAERGHEVRVFNLADVLGLAPESENGAVAQLPFESFPVTSPACIAV